MKTIFDLLVEHPFFKKMPEAYLQLISACGKNIHIKAGEYLAREGDPADHFYVLRSGSAHIEIHSPAKGAHIIQTLHAGEIAGWSWIFPPYLWTFDVRASQDLSAIALDGKCLRTKCEEDPRFGYLLMKDFAKIMTERLKATRLQVLDVYGGAGA